LSEINDDDDGEHRGWKHAAPVAQCHCDDKAVVKLLQCNVL